MSNLWSWLCLLRRQCDKARYIISTGKAGSTHWKMNSSVGSDRCHDTNYSVSSGAKGSSRVTATIYTVYFYIPVKTPTGALVIVSEADSMIHFE